MSNGKKEEKSMLSRAFDNVRDFARNVSSELSSGTNLRNVTENVKQMPSRIKQDLRMGFGIDPIPNDIRAQNDTSSYINRTKRNKALFATEQPGDGQEDKPGTGQSTMSQAALANEGIGEIGDAPTIPNPDAIGETERALLDAQKKGRSSTIATSAKGLLSDEDDTRKRRSLMGGLIS